MCRRGMGWVVCVALGNGGRRICGEGRRNAYLE